MSDPSAFEVLLDNARDKVAVVTADGTFRYVNAATRRILGFDPPELVGESVFDFVHPEDADRVRESFLGTVERSSSEPTTETFRHRAADGSWVWIESRMSNLVADEFDGFVVSSREVTDRVEAERRAARVDEIAAVSDDALWLFAADWSELLYVNDAIETIYGVSPAELHDDPIAFLETVHPDHLSRVTDAMERLSGGEPVDLEYRVVPEEECETWVWVKATPITEDGEVVRVAGFTRDVSDRHRREHHLVVMDNLLRHNLRNSLNVVLGATEHVENAAPQVAESAATIREAAEELLRSADKERRIIDALTTKTTHDRKPIATVLARTVDAVERSHPTATVETDIPIPESAGTAPVLVGTAVSELLENAILHTDADSPTVEVRARRRGGDVHVRVSDSAPPLPDVESDVLRGEVHAHDNVYHGNGLGLWLVYWCVELSDGVVTVESDADDGNDIALHVPLATEEEGDENPNVAASGGAVTDRGRSP